jgi:hypothetical protein
MKIRLTESQLRQVVSESVERLLAEGFIGDRLEARRKQREELARLDGILAGAGVDGLEKACHRIDGTEKCGFEFTMPLGDASSMAKSLKPQGVRMLAVRGGRYDSDGVSDSARVFAFFGRYPGDWM